MAYKTWEFGYLVEPDYEMVKGWLFTVMRYGVSKKYPTEIRATKDLTDGLKRLGD